MSLHTAESPPVATAPADRGLYTWQLDALVAWLRCGRRGVIEAVTGSGKTDLAIAAITDARRRGLFCLVVVPSRVLLEQWYERLVDAFSDATIGRLGDSRRDQVADCDILITTRHSAASYQPVPPEGRRGLLVADECHGYGGGTLRKSLMSTYDERLGLTATLERSDDGVEKVLIPFFGGVCYRYGFADAIADGVCAEPRVAFVSVELSAVERSEYIAVEEQLVTARNALRSIPDMPLDNFGDFLAAVSYLADHDVGPNGRAANDYLNAFGLRREIVANSTAKYEALGSFAPAIGDADGALIFTETVRAANHAVNRLDPHVGIEIITGDTARSRREEILNGLRDGDLDVVAAPRVLDEGVDVPNANLGIVVSASRTRRQMIQRMGRILRRKPLGSGARFVIIFARGTIEDPTSSDERDGFLDEMEDIAESTAVFTEDQVAQLSRFLDYSGPAVLTHPRSLGPFAPRPTSRRAGAEDGGDVDVDELFKPLNKGEASAWYQVVATRDRDLGADLIDAIDPERLYGLLSYVPWSNPTWLHHQVWENFGDGPQPDQDSDGYLDLSSIELPEIGKERAKKQRLSTGESPVQMTKVGDGWGVRCVGCGATSEPAPFKWQALDQTVECKCNSW